MESKQKPELILVSGDKAHEADAIIMLFERLKGRKATPEEVEAVRKPKPKSAK